MNILMVRKTTFLLLSVCVLFSCKDSNTLCYEVPTKKVKTCFDLDEQKYCVVGDFEKVSKENEQLYFREGKHGESCHFTFIQEFDYEDKVVEKYSSNKNFLKGPITETDKYIIYGFSPSPDTELPVLFMKVLDKKNSDVVLTVWSTSPHRLQGIVIQLTGENS